MKLNMCTFPKWPPPPPPPCQWKDRPPNELCWHGHHIGSPLPNLELQYKSPWTQNSPLHPSRTTSLPNFKSSFKLYRYLICILKMLLLSIVQSISENRWQYDIWDVYYKCSTSANVMSPQRLKKGPEVRSKRGPNPEWIPFQNWQLQPSKLHNSSAIQTNYKKQHFTKAIDDWEWRQGLILPISLNWKDWMKKMPSVPWVRWASTEKDVPRSWCESSCNF